MSCALSVYRIIQGPQQEQQGPNYRKSYICRTRKCSSEEAQVFGGAYATNTPIMVDKVYAV